MTNPLFSFSQCVRHAFFAGAGYGDLERISDEDQDRWVAYDPSELPPFKRVQEALERQGWNTDMTSAPLDRVIEVVGRYTDADAGYPRYVAHHDGKWLEYSRFAPQEIIAWAWRERTPWPSEPIDTP
ncbi:hypothetical protein [Ensifer aridi]|uniref:hypothetical protein n=1 Tax=Ensifer aridi TaxID=1708715 RepID=UPI001124E1E1|nr:hypothetical protein [Ensifer aridi]